MFTKTRGSFPCPSPLKSSRAEAADIVVDSKTSAAFRVRGSGLHIDHKGGGTGRNGMRGRGIKGSREEQEHGPGDAMRHNKKGGRSRNCISRSSRSCNNLPGLGSLAAAAASSATPRELYGVPSSESPPPSTKFRPGGVTLIFELLPFPYCVEAACPPVRQADCSLGRSVGRPRPWQTKVVMVEQPSSQPAAKQTSRCNSAVVLLFTKKLPSLRCAPLAATAWQSRSPASSLARCCCYNCTILAISHLSDLGRL